MITFLVVIIVLALLAVAALLVLGAELVRERDQWETFALSLLDERTDGAEARR